MDIGQGWYQSEKKEDDLNPTDDGEASEESHGASVLIFLSLSMSSNVAVSKYIYISLRLVRGSSVPSCAYLYSFTMFWTLEIEWIKKHNLFWALPKLGAKIDFKDRATWH